MDSTHALGHPEFVHGFVVDHRRQVRRGTVQHGVGRGAIDRAFCHRPAADRAHRDGHPLHDVVVGSDVHRTDLSDQLVIQPVDETDEFVLAMLIDTSIDNHDARLRFNPREWQGRMPGDTVMAYGLDLSDTSLAGTTSSVHEFDVPDAGFDSTQFNGIMAETCVFTIGHSTHPIDEFIRMLKANDIERVIDVRTVPGSRHNPQFGERELATSMPNVGIDYQRLKELGGLRHTPMTAATINGAWRNRSFRNYADYMQTPEFAAGIDELIALAKKQTVAIMCAEAVPWRCHRSLIGDALLARGLQVTDIMSLTSTKPHTMTGFAKVDGDHVWYPPED